jgi:SAM-dependent methyltransferase
MIRHVFGKNSGSEPLPIQSGPEPVSPTIGRFRLAKPNLVELHAEPVQIARLLSQTSETWKRLGETEPHWSVMAWDRFLSSTLDDEEFYRTGEFDVAVLSAYFQRAGFDLHELQNVIELGCGVGRLTTWLSNRVKHVTGVDVSPPHLLIARQRLEKAKITNVHLIQITALSDIESLPMADLFYSVIVMQHNTPPVIAELLKAFLSRVNVGGFAFFQVPTYALNYEFALERYVPDSEGRMEMHVLPQKKIFEILNDKGFVLLEIQEDSAVGSTAMASHSFFARRLHQTHQTRRV